MKIMVYGGQSNLPPREQGEPWLRHTPGPLLQCSRALLLSEDSSPAWWLHVAWPSEWCGRAAEGVDQGWFFTVLSNLVAPHPYYTFHKASKGTFSLTERETAFQRKAG